jgi:hypothetical protein
MLLKNGPDFVQKQKSFLQSADFWALSAQRTTVLYQFWLFPPSWQWTTVDCENGPLCSQETEETFF